MSARAPFSVDLETLLQPISPERPAGEWLRYEGAYDQIQEARRQDDASLPQGIWETTQKRANWQLVARLCQDALRTRSKDLQIAAWLLEAWLQLYGYRGLTEGLHLAHGLCQRFWDDMFPALDPEDPSFRTGPIEWVDQKIPLQLRLVALTRPPDGEAARPYSYGDWELVLHRSRRDRSEEEPGGVTEAAFLASASMTPRAVFETAAAELGEAQQAVEMVEALLDERLGRQASALLHLRDSIAAIQRLIEQLIGPRRGAAPAAPAGDEAAQEDDLMAAQDAGEGGGGGPIRSRAEAYRRLQEAADYLLRTEPHSPTPYLIRRAVSWGNKSLAELLAEIVEGDASVQALYRLLAMRGPERRDPGEP